MRLSSSAGNALGHLTYCTNIHAGESLDELLDSLTQHMPDIRAGLVSNEPIAIGLRLGAQAAEQLDNEQAMRRLQSLLDKLNLYVFTINGFPYGQFHGQTVKEGAYRPDWSEPERLLYTNRLANILVQLLPTGMTGSISTVPGTFRAWVDDGRLDRIRDHLVDHVSTLVQLARDGHGQITLALEPEPGCLLESIDDTVQFFESHLYSQSARERLAQATGLDDAQALAALQRHLGVCYDVCHAAVAFERPRESLRRLNKANIPVAKLQLSSALRVARLDANMARALKPFIEPVYLHQVSARDTQGDVRRWLDLPAALADADFSREEEWRVHFHVPIFLSRLAEFDTTQGFLAEILALHREHPICDQLEVETYTWDVLPARYRDTSLGAAIARELNWVRAELGERPAALEKARS